MPQTLELRRLAKHEMLSCCCLVWSCLSTNLQITGNIKRWRIGYQHKMEHGTERERNTKITMQNTNTEIISDKIKSMQHDS